MNLDIHPYKQSISEGDKFRYCLNMITENDYYSNIITTEQSNKLIAEIATVLGWAFSDDSMYLFTEDNKIQKFSNGALCTLVDLPCLNFCNNIYTQTKKDDCGNLEIFFQDGVNPDRYINLGETYEDCCDLDLNQCLNCNKLKVNISSGNLESGTYAFTTKEKDSYNYCPITENLTISNVEKVCDRNKDFSNKSFVISNVPENHDLFVIKTVKGVTQVHKINSNYNGEHLETIDINEVVTPSTSYESSSVSEVFNNKLLRANLKVDYLDYQCKAFEIDVTPYTIKVPANKAYLFPDVKSFMGDELYNLSINFITCTGERTPAYPLNPKLKDEGYECGGIKYDSVHDVVPADDPNNWKGCPAKVWELFNTSRVTKSPQQETIITESCGKVDIEYGVWEEFTLGYHESCEDYDFECLDCEAPKRGQFRMPDRCHFTSEKEDQFALPVSEGVKLDVPPLIPNNTNPEDNAYIYPILLRIDNIDLPDLKKYPYYEIRSTKRNDVNKTVLAKGLTHHMFGIKFEDGSYYATPSLGVNSNHYSNYYSEAGPLTENLENTLNDDVDCQLVPAYTFHSPNTSYNQPLLNPQYIKVNKQLSGLGMHYGSVESPYGGSRIAYNLFKSEDKCKYIKYSGGGYIEENVTADAPSGVDYPIFNVYKESSVYLQLEELLNLKTLDSVQFDSVRNENVMLGIEPDRSCEIQGDESWNISLHGTFTGNGQDAQSSPHSIESVCSNYITLKKDYCYPLNSPYENVISCNNTSSTIAKGDSYINYWNYKRSARFSSEEDTLIRTSQMLSSIIYFPVESDINTNLDNRGDCTVSLDPSFDNDRGYPGSVLGETYESDGIYNVDYDQFDYDFSDPCYTTTLAREFCCLENLSNRLVWSETEVLNNKRNNWATNLANNYIDIPQDKGSITNIVNFGDEIFVHTTDAIFRVFTNQQLEVNDNLIYLGQGNLFSQSPVELYATPEGYAGLRDRQESLKNQFGYFWVDHKARKLHMLKGKDDLREILGVRNYYKETMTDELFRLGFDPRHNRVFFTQDETLSIEPITGTPISFHSYIPDFYLWDRCDMWTSKNGIYLHNKECKTLNFYGNQSEHIIESVQPLNYQAFKEHQDYIECNNCEYCCNDVYDYLFYSNCNSSGWCTTTKDSKGLIKVTNIKNVKFNSKHTFSDHRIRGYSEDISNEDTFKDRYVIIRRRYNKDNELILLDELPIIKNR